MNLTEPPVLKAFLAKHGVKAKKGLGQHFLTSSRVVQAICDQVADFASVLEIGPGPGLLTGPLCERVPQVIALEVDERMPELLAESAPGAQVILADALKADIGEILSGMPAPRALVSNLPYYITGPLLGRIADQAERLNMAVLMMQAEVGRRILAEAGNRERGALSVFLQTVFEIKKVVNVPPGCFSPPPKVDSIVLAFKPTGQIYSDKLREFVRQGFGQPRKTAANNLAAAFEGRVNAVAALTTAGLKESVRPHEITNEQWPILFRTRKDLRSASEGP